MQIFTPKDPEYTTLQGEHFDGGLLALICLDPAGEPRCERITNYGYIIRLPDGRIADVHVLGAGRYGVRYWTDIDRIIARVVRYAVRYSEECSAAAIGELERELEEVAAHRNLLADSASSNLSLRAANKRLRARLAEMSCRNCGEPRPYPRDFGGGD